MFRVKICGITNLTDARRAVRAGADALGFNFYLASPRYLTPAKAARIARQLPRGVAKVGIFVNEPANKVRRIARAVRLDFVQLHGDETPQTVAELARHVPVIKALRVRRGFRPATLKRYRRAQACLLDGFSTRLPGGTGTRFNWRIARRAKRHVRIVLSGGLRPENVARAIAQARPAAVDVCSGVEARPGKKDPAKLRALMQQIDKVRSRLG